MPHISTPRKAKAISMPLIGIFLLIVQPIAVLIIRAAINELRFDGLSLISLMLCGLGGWILTKDWSTTADG